VSAENSSIVRVTVW